MSHMVTLNPGDLLLQNVVVGLVGHLSMVDTTTTTTIISIPDLKPEVKVNGTWESLV